MTVREPQPSWRSVLIAGLVCATVLGCDPAAELSVDSGLTPYVVSGAVDDKSKLYNLIGRWYPTSEVERLRDDTLTPAEWCARDPIKLAVMPDSVEVRCDKGVSYNAAIARVKTSTRPGELTLLLRVSKESPLRQVRFEDVQGPTATIVGLPCNGGRPQPHQRFPEYEILTRQIMGGRRCSQLDVTEVSPGVLR